MDVFVTGSLACVCLSGVSFLFFFVVTQPHQKSGLAVTKFCGCLSYSGKDFPRLSYKLSAIFNVTCHFTSFFRKNGSAFCTLAIPKLANICHIP